jgi:hypothetical protein
MTKTIRHWHRLLVRRIADSRWLAGRAGADAAWAHYERHARAWRRSAERHAAARSGAAARAARLHDRRRARRQAGRPEDRILPGWQSAIARFLGADTRREGRRR